MIFRTCQRFTSFRHSKMTTGSSLTVAVAHSRRSLLIKQLLQPPDNFPRKINRHEVASRHEMGFTAWQHLGQFPGHRGWNDVVSKPLPERDALVGWQFTERESICPINGQLLRETTGALPGIENFMQVF